MLDEKLMALPAVAYFLIACCLRTLCSIALAKAAAVVQ